MAIRLLQGILSCSSISPADPQAMLRSLGAISRTACGLCCEASTSSYRKVRKETHCEQAGMLTVCSPSASQCVICLMSAVLCHKHLHIMLEYFSRTWALPMPSCPVLVSELLSLVEQSCWSTWRITLHQGCQVVFW